MTGRRLPLVERFWNKVAVGASDECWLWTASTQGGYGQVGGSGRSGAPIRAHRLSYELHHGKIPDGLFVLHRCDVRRCVNPDHLFAGTAAENTADMIQKGRGYAPRGEYHPCAKLNSHAVATIRELRRRGISQRELAARFGVDASTVSNVVRRRTWLHVKAASDMQTSQQAASASEAQSVQGQPNPA